MDDGMRQPTKRNERDDKIGDYDLLLNFKIKNIRKNKNSNQMCIPPPLPSMQCACLPPHLIRSTFHRRGGGTRTTSLL